MSEIVEEGVTKITLAASTVYNYTFEPAEGRVKWFKDELGQAWVKLTVSHKNRDYQVYKTVDHVWPADRVVEVQYEKSRETP